MNSDDRVHDDRATQRQSDGLPAADPTPLLSSSDTYHQGAPEFAKLEDGDRSGEGRQVAPSIGLLHADVVHQSVHMFSFIFLHLPRSSAR